MFITRKHISRRMFLRGAGVAVGLPFLDAMVPAGTASSIASAVAFPAANAVRTTPGSSLFDPYFPRRRIHRGRLVLDSGTNAGCRSLHRKN